MTKGERAYELYKQYYNYKYGLEALHNKLIELCNNNQKDAFNLLLNTNKYFSVLNGIERAQESNNEVSNKLVLKLEKMLQFYDEEERQKWVDVVIASSDGVFDDMTFEIIERE